MDQQDMMSAEEANTWPELSADLTLARSTARSITLDTQRASSDGRILEVTAQLDLMRTHLSSLEQHVFDATADAGASGELLSRFVSLDAEIADTTARFEGLAARVAAAEENVATTMMQSVDGFDARLVMVEDARMSQTTELNQLTSYLEQAFTRITELAEVIEVERAANASSRSGVASSGDQLHSAVNDRFDSLHADFEELTQRLDTAANSIDQSTASVQEELTESMRLLEARISASEVRLDGVHETSSSIQFLQARAEALEADATSSATAATSHRSEIVDHVDHAHARIDETQSRIDEARNELRDLRTRLSHPTEAAAAPSDVEELRTTISHAVETNIANTEAHRFNAEAIASAAQAVAETNIAASNTKRLAQDALDRVGNVAENADLVGQRVDIVQSAIDDLDSGLGAARSIVDSTAERVAKIEPRVHNLAGGIDSLHGKVDNAATALDAAHTRIDDVEGAARDAHARIDENNAAVGERIDDFAQAVDDRFNENHQALDVRFNENRHAIDQRLTETHQAISENQRTIDHRLNESEHAIDQRFDENHQAISEQIDAAGGEINELRKAVDRANAAEAASAGTEDELRRTNERIESVSANIDTLTTLLEETTHRFGDVDRNIDGVDERSAESLELAIRARDHGEQISSRIDQQDEQLAAAFDAASSVAEKAALNADRLGEAEQNIAVAQRRLEENLATAAETTSRALELHNGLQASIDETVHEASNVLEERLLSRIEEARSNMQNVVFDTENKAAQSRETLRRDIEQRMDAVESDVVDRLTAIEDSSTTDVRLEAFETTLHTVEVSLRDVEGLTKDAHTFSESLRLIQANFVRTIQGELDTQTNQMQTLDDRANAAESASVDFATAERVHMLEAKLVEALQTISQLTQLQRRNTTVEAQLTDTLTATSHGVESTQNSIVVLRDELERAQSRIAQLEAPQTVRGGEIAPRATGAATAMAGRVFGDAATQAPGDLAVIDDDVDTGWFTESYARKNQEPKAS
jgi:chromosome segregation ATPase